MADEILNKLGFDVSQALTALQSLDNALAKNQLAFQNSYSALATWNAQAQVTLALMRDMASVSAGMKAPKISTPTVATTPTAPGAATWPPADLESRIQQAIGLTNKFGGAVSVAGDKVRVSGMRGAQAIDQMNNSAQRFTVSWQMISRIVVTQAVVRALSAIRNMMREIVTNSIEFQRSLAEIQAITPKIHGDFVSLGNEAVILSKRFNIPLPQVTEALYQSISNQFVTVSDRTRIMEASMKLARVGCMELDDAVLLLTGTLNAYGIGAENAEVAAAKFFKTIQMGRVRGKELADTIGTVIPFAAQLGVSLDEVAASYVSMTIGGLNAHKTATGLRQAMVAMLKPSEDMKKVVRELGFGSPEQLVQARGLIGAMQAISDAANGMGSEVVKSVRNVRALTAQLTLTREKSRAVQEALEEIGNVGPESMRKLYEEFTAIPAEKLTREVNALSVSLTHDLGEKMVGVLGNLMEFAGGADQISAALQALINVLMVGGAVVLAFGATWGLLTLSLGPVGFALVAITAGLTALIGVSSYQSIRAIQDIKNVAQAARDASIERVRAASEGRRVEVEETAKFRQAAIRNYEEQAANVRRIFFKQMDDLRLKNTELINSTRETLSTLVSSQGRVVTAYRSAAKAAADAIQQSRERQIDIEAAYSDAVFKYITKNKTAYQQAEDYMRRARMLASEAEDAMRAAKTPEQIAAAQAAFQRAEAAASEAEQIANGTRNTQLQQDAQRQVLFVMRQKIEAEQALQQLQAAEAKRLAAKAAEEQTRLNEMKVSMKAILDDLQAFDKEGAREPRVLADQQRRLQENLTKFKAMALAGQEVSIADFIGLEQLQQRISLAIGGGVTDIRLKEFYGTPEAFAKLRKDIEEGVGPVRLWLRLAAEGDTQLQNALKGLTAEQGLGLLSSKLGDSARQIDEYNKTAGAAADEQDTVNEAIKNARERLDDWLKVASKPLLVKTAWRQRGVPAQINLDEKMADATYQMSQEAAKFLNADIVDLDWSAFAKLQNTFKQYIKTVKPSEEQINALNQFMIEARQAISAAESVRKLTRGQKELSQPALEAGSRIDRIENALKQALQEIQQTKNASKEVETSALQTKESIKQMAQTNMTNYVNQVNSAATAMWNLAQASVSVQTPSAGAAELAAFGGRAGRYLASGGPVGTDVVPAWLSRGEFVMNTGAANKFASQLVAMNAGVQPVFRSEGGSVTNIGDINVSVTDGGTGRQTARDIAAELRRELRRGTTIL